MTIVRGMMAALVATTCVATLVARGAEDDFAGRDRMVLLETSVVRETPLDTGFFRDVRRADGRALKVREFAGKEPNDPWRALQIEPAAASADDEWIAVTLKSAYPVRVSAEGGSVGRKVEGPGEIRLQLKAGQSVVLATTLSVGDVAPKFSRDRFMIGASYAFPKDRPVEESQVRLLHEAGIDFGCANCRAAERDKLDLLEKYGLVMNGREDGRWWGGDGDRAGKMRTMKPLTEFETLARRLADEWKHAALPMTDICDEPSALDMDYCGEACARMININPAVMPFVNIYPNYASVSWTSGKERINQLGTTNYAEHVAAYCRTMPLDYICYDHYPFEDKPDDTLWGEKRFYDNFNDVERACVRTGRRLWYIGQVNTKPGRKKYLTENMLRFEAMASLAFGAEAYIWATWYPSWWTNSVFQAGTLEKSEHYDRIRRINGELHELGAETIRFRHVSATYVAFPEWAKSVEAFDNGIVSGLRAADGTRLVVGDMVAKRDFERRRAIVVFAANDMGDVKRKNRTVVFRAKGVVTVKGPHGFVPCVADERGRYSFSLTDGSAAVILVQVT